MAIRGFSRQEAIKFGWEITRKKLGFFITVMIIIFLLVGLFAAMGEITKKSSPLASGIIFLLGNLLQIVVSMGWLKIMLKLYDSQEAHLSDIFSCPRLLFKYLISAIVYGMIIFAGIFLLIIPGIIWAIRGQFFSCFIIDKELGPIEALKKSWDITRGLTWQLIVFYCLLFLINLAGILALILGLFIAIPLTALAWVFVYRKLSIPTPT